ncbi:MAG TPA: hypothetical protein VI793_15345, partial [Anaerolineales bacterium]|nr:hypothetical protein [Anaerolineales bacterium]
ANPFSGILHPLVMITTLFLGVINGAKVALVICLGLAGLAQWWLARILKLGRTARLWSALLIVVGGHLAPRMATGQFATILATATSSLALVAAIDLGVTGQRRATLVLAIVGALVILSGHGYVQLSLISWAPALLFFVLDKSLRPRPVWKEYALAVSLSLLLACVILVPMLHFLPNFAKDTDPDFGRAQPLEYIPLNLVTRDWGFMHAAILGKFDAPELFALYIGWVPVLMAFLCLRYARREDYPVLLCLTIGFVMSMLMASALPLRWVVKFAPFFAGFRHPSLMAVLAVPALVALAAYGLDKILSQEWPQIVFSMPSSSLKLLPISSAWILLLPLLWGLSTAYSVTQFFVGAQRVSDLYGYYEQVIRDLKEPGLQWVAPPLGEHFLVEPAVQLGLKLTNVAFPQWWKDRSLPAPRLVISRSGDYPGAEVVTRLNDIPVYWYNDRTYAYVDADSQVFPCQASGQGGDLTVRCSNAQAGKLIVQEYTWVGWQVWRDQSPTSLLSGDWLSADAPAGEHVYQFRYRPWDVAVGLSVTLIGISLVVWLWLHPPAKSPATETAEISQPAL